VSTVPRPRTARASDLPAIVGLLTDADLPLEGLGGARLWVVEVDGEVAAIAALERHGDEALLRSLAVGPDHRGAGIGKALVAHVIEVAAGEDLREVHLLTTTAVDWFAGLGFERRDRADAPAELEDAAELRGACPPDAELLVRAVGS
jgi:N-acetylglutamate synthase-like GNAT family acetyltransferase